MSETLAVRKSMTHYPENKIVTLQSFPRGVEIAQAQVAERLGVGGNDDILGRDPAPTSSAATAFERARAS
jgi:hypothetical protein